MSATLNLANASAKAGLDAITALLNSGGTGKLRIYDGTPPADCDTALSSNNVLADFALNATAFAASTDANPNALATANSITDVNASASGMATFFRLLTNAGVAKVQGNVGTSAATCIVTSTAFVSGQPCHVVSLTLTQPE